MSESGERAAYDIEGEKLRGSVAYVGLLMERAARGDEGVTSLRIRGPRYVGDEYLAVLASLNDEGGPVVGFHTAPTLGALLIGVGNRLRNGSLKWHEDKYAQKSDGQ